ncbi:MAG: ANTAR domain-containing protein [Lachnospiraceae bacterium]|nr:ANTAR domain-containing protein [Lachnospiraceae bacterium]
MGYIVIAMPRREDAVRLKQIVIRNGIWEEVLVCSCGNEIVQTAEQKDVNLVITTRRLKDMGYEELVSYLPSELNLVLLTKDPSVIHFSGNVIPLELPLRIEKLSMTLRRHLPDQRVVRKSKKPKRSAEEQKLIDEAKTRLMERKNLSEPDAFRYLQKNSMDTGKSLVEAAQMILLMVQ